MTNPDDDTVREWTRAQTDAILEGLRYQINNNKTITLLETGAIVPVDLFIPYPETRH